MQFPFVVLGIDVIMAVAQRFMGRDYEVAVNKVSSELYQSNKKKEEALSEEALATRVIDQAEKPRWSTIYARSLEFVMSVGVFFAVFYAKTVAQAFDCSIDSANGRAFLDIEPHIECVIDNEEYAATYAKAVLGVLFFLGWLVSLTLLTFKKVDKVGDGRVVPQFGFLSFKYQRNFFAWELVVLALKLGLCFMSLFNSGNPAAASFTSACVVVTALIAQATHGLMRTR